MGLGLKKAIAESVEKWRALLAGESPLIVAFHQCSLCWYTSRITCCTRFDCAICPLGRSGHGCLEEGSLFFSMKEACEKVGHDDINHPAIRPHAEAMYAALLDLQREYDAE